MMVRVSLPFLADRVGLPSDWTLKAVHRADDCTVVFEVDGEGLPGGEVCPTIREQGGVLVWEVDGRPVGAREPTRSEVQRAALYRDWFWGKFRS